MTESAKAYPLAWPSGWKRTKAVEHSRFGDHSIYSASRKLNRELDLLGAMQIILSTNLVLNRDGTPRSSQKQPNDRGVAVYFKLDGKDQCIPCDRWDSVADNIHAITLCVGAMRGMDRWGAGEFVSAAFSGFKAIPEKTEMDWRNILELQDDSNILDAERNYKQIAMRCHPDKPGGSDEKMSKLNLAIREARNSLI